MGMNLFMMILYILIFGFGFGAAFFFIGNLVIGYIDRVVYNMVYEVYYLEILKMVNDLNDKKKVLRPRYKYPKRKRI